MSDYNEETSFLRRMLSYDDSFKSRNVEKMIVRVQRDQASVMKAAWTMGLLAILSSMVSQADFFQSEPAVRLRVVCITGLAALICFIAFVGVLIFYRARLNRLRHECCGLIGKLIESQKAPRMDFLLLPGSTGPAPEGEMLAAQKSTGG